MRRGSVRTGWLPTLLLLGVALAPTPVAADKDAAKAFDLKVIAKIQAAVQPYIESELLVGLALGVLDGPRKLVLGFGRKDVDTQGAPDGRTVFEIGSVSKAVTGVLLAHDVVTERLSLDTPIEKLLTADKVELAAGDGAPITVLDISTHTSGLPRMPTNFRPADPNNPYADYDAARLYAFLADWEPSRAPGARYEYSNLAVGLLGHALARSADKTYEALLRERIAKPLGMTGTRIVYTPEMRRHMARPHARDTSPAATWDLTTFAGAGGIRSTVNDMLGFVGSALRPDESTLGKAQALAQAEHRKTRSGPAMGLGWHIGKGGRRWHNGQTGGYHSYVAIDAASDRGVVLLSNTATGHVDKLGGDILAILAGETPPKPEVPEVIEIDPKVMTGLAGTYPLSPTFILTVEHVGRRLMARATGQPAFRLFAESEDAWRYRIVEARITFERDDAGKVTQLTLHQNGRHLPGPRQDE